MPNLDDALLLLDETPDESTATQTRPSFQNTLPAAQPTHPLETALTVLDGPDEADRLRGAVEVGTKQQPANALRTLQLIEQTGLPADFINRNSDFVEQESAKQEINPQQLRKDSPAFADWLAESPAHVAAAQPDLNALSFIEQQLRNIPAQFEQGQRTVAYSDVMLEVVQGLLDKTDITDARRRQAELEAEMGQPDETGLADETGVAGVAQRAPGWVAQQLPILARTLTEQVKSGAEGVAVGAALGGATGGLPGAATGGLIVGGAMWRVGAAMASAKMEFAHAFGDYETLKDAEGNTLDQETAMGLAGMVGVINGAIDGFFGIEGLTSKLPGVNQFTRQGIKELLTTPTTRAAVLSAARTVGQVMVTEGVTEALQMYITKAGGVALQAVKDGGSPAQWLGQIFTGEHLQQALTEAEAGAFGGGGIATVLSSPQLAQDVARVKQANQAKQTFEAIGQAVEGTTFSKDLPVQLRAIIERATKDGPVETLYVPEHAFTEYFQHEGVDPREVYREITGDVDAYDQAVETGSDLPIQTADYAQKLAGTKHNGFFANELRTSIDAMNGFEAAEWVQQQDELEKAAAEQQDVQTSIAGDPAAAVRLDIAGQLTAMGFDPSVVTPYAALFESRYTARAERRGLGESPADLFRQQNLQITRPVPEVLQRLGNTTELDALLDRLRTGDVPKQEEVFGQSLMEFLRKAGGVQDQGGKLAARNVDAATKPFTKKFVQKQGMTLEEAAQRAAEAGYLEGRDLNAFLDALDQEARGTPVFALGKKNAAAFEVRQTLDSLKQYLDAKGLDLATSTNQQIKQALGEAMQQTLPAETGQTFAQGGQTETAAFKKWFGDSKVVDAQGNPLVVYHGSHSGLRKGAWTSTDSTNIGVATFTSDHEIASKYSRGMRPVGEENQFVPHPDGEMAGTVFSVFLKIQKPITEDTTLEEVLGTEEEADEDRSYDLDPFALTASLDGLGDIEYIAEHAEKSDTFRKYLQKKGYDGFIFPDQESGGITYIPFHKEQLRQSLPTVEGQTFAQGTEGAKGSITFGGQSISIKLLEQADLSTFIHESGHLYLNELLDDAQAIEAVPAEQRTPVQTQLLTDLDTLHRWLGNKEDGKRITVAQHEQFARGFEAYAMEGKSPSQAMRDVFATFRRWLIQAYRSLTTAPLNVTLTVQVREVMDRMLATDEEIARASMEAEVLPMFTNALAAGMSPTEFAAYHDTVAKASLTARETLQKQLMAQYQRQHEQWWKDERDALRLQITEQVNRQPVYVALSVLQTGTMPDGSPLPTGVEPMKLDRKALAGQFGKDFLARMPAGTMTKNGMHQDTAAHIFGFNTGQEMVLALVNARPKVPLINAEADQQMQSRHGDMRVDGTMADAARAAVMNEHQEAVIAAEIRALNKKQREVAPFVNAATAEIATAQRQGRALLRTVIPTLKETRELARTILGRTALKQINPYHYSVAARQASKQATAALAKDEYLDAGLFKQRELLNLALFWEALIIKERIEQAHELATSFGKPDATLAATRNVDLISVGRAILAQYGLARPVEKTAADYLAPIKTYDKDLYDQWIQVVNARAPRPVDYNALAVDEFTHLFDDLQSLWLLSRRTKQMKIDDQLVDRQQVVDEIAAVLAGFTTQQRDHVVGAQTKWADTLMGLLSWRSALKRVESWVDLLDAGDINGVVRRAIWTPISEAAETFRAEKKKVLEQYLTVIQPIEQSITRDLIPAPELGPNVAFRGRTALLHALLHTGNESNLSKLLRGYQWEPANWQRFLDRAIRDELITKADYDYAQGVWDLLESIKPQAQQAHHEMYGYYFSEITAKAITTPWGDYKGGYVPAIADRAQSVDQAIREEKELFDQGGNSFMFPTTGRGFTKARVEQYAAPLALDLTTIPVHLDKTMRFVHLEPRIKDAARLVTNKRLRTALDAMDPTVAKDMLVPWLQRSAQQTVSTPGRNRHADRLFRYLRKTSGAQIMVGNILNTLQQFTGFSLALVKVQGRYMRGALMNYLRHPIDYADQIAAQSAFMRGRTMTQVMEIQATIDDILLNPTKYEQARKFAERHGYFLQQGTQNIVDLVTWGGAYEQAIAQDLDARMAVRAADAAVRATQGRFAPEDISAFEAGTPFTRAFTMFYSYFNMEANLLDTEFRRVAREMGLKRGAGRAFYIYLTAFLIPSIMAEGIVTGIGGFDPDDDDDYLNEALSLFFGSQLRTALAFFPGVGPITLAGINAFNDKWYDDRISTSPVVSLLESAVRAPKSLYKAMSEEGHAKRAVRDVLTLVGLVTGLPVGSLIRPLGYLADVADGVAQPEDAADVARGLLSGRDVNRTK